MNKLREIRSKLQVTQKDLADAVGVSQPYIHDLEMGNRKMNPAISIKIAKKLGVSVNDICPAE